MTEQVRRWQEYARRREAPVSVQAIQEAAGGQETGTMAIAGASGMPDSGWYMMPFW